MYLFVQSSYMSQKIQRNTTFWFESLHFEGKYIVLRDHFILAIVYGYSHHITFTATEIIAINYVSPRSWLATFSF